MTTFSTEIQSFCFSDITLINLEENITSLAEGKTIQGLSPRFFIAVSVSYRVELLHLLLQHARDHPDEVPVSEFTCLLVKVGQQRSHRGAFTVQLGVPVHAPVIKKQQQQTHTNTGSLMAAAQSKQESKTEMSIKLCISLVFEEDVEYIRLVLETLRVF